MAAGEYASNITPSMASGGVEKDSKNTNIKIVHNNFKRN